MERNLEIFREYGAVLSTPTELYTDLFRIGEGYIQKAGEYRVGKEFKGNPMIYINSGEDFSGTMRRYILLEDTFFDWIKKAQENPSNLLNAVTYFGRKKDKEHSDRCFGLIFDIDKVTDSNLNNFLHGMRFADFYPCPNYAVISKSGKGMHLYYLFDEPLRLFPMTKVQLKEIKYQLTRRLWNQYTSKDENVQYQSYDQSFMVAGTYETMKVFHFPNQERWNVRDLCNYTENAVFREDLLYKESKYTIEEVEKKFPKWYEKVIVNGEKTNGHWECKPDLYEWWKKQILSGATYGHRYWCIMMLVVYAVKCGIPIKQVKEDAYELQTFLNGINPEKPFTKSDVKSALDCYDLQFATFPINDISRLSGITIKKNKRNGRTQGEHLEEARALRDIRQKRNGKVWSDNSPHSGRNPKKDIVRQWKEEHPKGKKIECHRDTGLSRITIDKWWNE